MKVWLIEESGWDYHATIGVFQSRKSALRYLEENNYKRSTKYPKSELWVEGHSKEELGNYFTIEPYRVRK